VYSAPPWLMSSEPATLVVPQTDWSLAREIGGRDWDVSATAQTTVQPTVPYLNNTHIRYTDRSLTRVVLRCAAALFDEWLSRRIYVLRP
jgi:hypothetical protein